MASKVYLAAGDTGPQVRFYLNDDFTGNPIDLSNVGTTLAFKFRAIGSTALTATIAMGKISGTTNPDGTINTNPPYNTANGFGGGCAVNWTAGALALPGEYEGEIEITFSDGTIQSVYNLQKFSVRADV